MLLSDLCIKQSRRAHSRNTATTTFVGNVCIFQPNIYVIFIVHSEHSYFLTHPLLTLVRDFIFFIKD